MQQPVPSVPVSDRKASSPRSERRFSRTFLILFSVLLTVVLAEGSVRLIEWFSGTTHELELQAHIRNDSGGYYQAHPYIGYVHRASMQTPDVRQEHFSINSLGFRGEEFEQLKPAGTFRVVCLGGSTTFGVGVATDAETWPSLLQSRLNRALRAGDAFARVEVINAGVVGYTLMESFANLKMRVLPLQPDLVIIYHGINDARVVGRPNFRPDYTHVRRAWTVPVPSRWDLLFDGSHLYAWLRGKDAVPALNDFTELPALVEPRGEVPGLATWRRTLTECVAVARVSRCEVMLTSFAHTTEREARNTLGLEETYRTLARLNDVQAQVARNQSAPFVDLAKIVGTSAELYVDPVHLSSAGNLRIATALSEEIVRRGYLTAPIELAPMQALTGR